MLQGVEVGTSLRLTADFSDMRERPRFWQYWGCLCSDLARYGLLAAQPHSSHVRYVEDIDGFAKADLVRLPDVKEYLPLDWLEQDIQEAFEEIIGEPFSQKDWGGEDNDLYTSQLRLRGNRATAAFMLKGRGTKGELAISKCGKNGDQIDRLLHAHADVYIIQHVDAISQAVRNNLTKMVELENRRGHVCSACFLDGFDTARILKANGRL